MGRRRSAEARENGGEGEVLVWKNAMWNRRNENEERRFDCGVFRILVAEVPAEVETNLP